VTTPRKYKRTQNCHKLYHKWEANKLSPICFDPFPIWYYLLRVFGIRSLRIVITHIAEAAATVSGGLGRLIIIITYIVITAYIIIIITAYNIIITTTSYIWTRERRVSSSPMSSSVRSESPRNLPGSGPIILMSWGTSL